MELTSEKGAFSENYNAVINHSYRYYKEWIFDTHSNWRVVIQYFVDPFIVFFLRETRKLDRTSSPSTRSYITSGIVKIPAVIEYYGY